MKMNIITQIAVNIISGLIGVWIGRAWYEFQRAIRLRRAKRFWKVFVSGELQVVVGRFLEFASFEQSGFLGVGDAMALAELRMHFESLGLRDFSVSYADRLDGDSLKTNLILIGGPDVNTITKEAVVRIQSTLRFGNPEHHEIAIYDSVTDRIYAPLVRTDSNEIIKDYGVVLKTTNPFAPNKQVLIVAGSFGYGTWAGIRFITSRQFIENPMVLEGMPIECLIETDIVRGTPQDIRLIVLRALKPKVSVA